jgi:chromosome segregation ATPase
MNPQARGITAVGAVVVVVVLLVVIGAVMYFTSDVFSTKVDAAVDQFAHWTPENIAKDPENYLNFCEKQANKAIEDLKASEISVAQSRAKLETMRAEAKNKVAVGEKTLAELKELYTKAEASNGWPATWQGQPREKDWVRRQIVSLHGQVTSQRALLGKVEAGLNKLDVQVGRVQDGRAKAQEQIAEIKSNREILKVQKLTDDLTSRLVSMKGVLQATVNTAAETTGVISLDQLAAETPATVDDAEFQKIMGGVPATAPK